MNKRQKKKFYLRKARYKKYNRLNKKFDKSRRHLLQQGVPVRSVRYEGKRMIVDLEPPILTTEVYKKREG